MQDSLNYCTTGGEDSSQIASLNMEMIVDSWVIVLVCMRLSALLELSGESNDRCGQKLTYSVELFLSPWLVLSIIGWKCCNILTLPVFQMILQVKHAVVFLWEMELCRFVD